MAINTETLEDRLSLGNLEGYVVTLDIQSFTSPESFDPTQTSGGGNKYVNSLLGVSILGVETGGAHDVRYDHLNTEFHAESTDGTAAASDLGEVRVLILGDPSA
jgi:hypothetical protein